MSSTGSKEGAAERSASLAPAIGSGPVGAAHDAGDSAEVPRLSVRSVFESLGLIAAPVTIASALAFYIGVVRQDVLAGHFGLDVSVLALTPRDYVLRSVDALVPFLVGLCVLVLLVLVACALASAWLRSQSLTSRLRAMGIIATAGAFAIAFGVWRLGHPVPLTGLYLAGPVSLGLGAALLAATVRPLLRHHLPASRAVLHTPWAAPIASISVAVLTLSGIFWAANDYARTQGQARAVGLEQSVSALPGAIVHSATRLHIDAPGVEEQVLDAGDGTETFRYRGLRLLIQTSGKYLLLPDTWSPQDGTVVVLPDSDAIRVDFTAPTAQ